MAVFGSYHYQPVPREARLSDKVAAMLQESIVSGELLPGDRLPPERELSDGFGVSRTVVREAVRSLLAKGLVESRGVRGLRISSAGNRAVRESVELFVRSNRIDYPRVHEVRAVLEIRIAALAAGRAVGADVEALRRACDRMEAAVGDPVRAAEEDVEFHRLLARATHNDLFLVLLDAMGETMREIRRATLGVPGRIGVGVAFHRQILAGVEAGDPERAEAAMREHLDDASAAWRRLGDG